MLYSAMCYSVLQIVALEDPGTKKWATTTFYFEVYRAMTMLLDQHNRAQNITLLLPQLDQLQLHPPPPSLLQLTTTTT